MADYDTEYPAGFFGCFLPTNQFTKRILHVSDILVAAFIITPLVVTHWYGSFAFMEQYSEYFPLWPTLAFGLCWHLLMALSRYHIHATIKRPDHVEKSILRSIGSFLFTKGYIYVFSVSGILWWRAIFNLMLALGMVLSTKIAIFRYTGRFSTCAWFGIYRIRFWCWSRYTMSFVSFLNPNFTFFKLYSEKSGFWLGP